MLRPIQTRRIVGLQAIKAQSITRIAESASSPITLAGVEAFLLGEIRFDIPISVLGFRLSSCYSYTTDPTTTSFLSASIGIGPAGNSGQVTGAQVVNLQTQADIYLNHVYYLVAGTTGVDLSDNQESHIEFADSGPFALTVDAGNSVKLFASVPSLVPGPLQVSVVATAIVYYLPLSSRIQ